MAPLILVFTLNTHEPLLIVRLIECRIYCSELKVPQKVLPILTPHVVGIGVGLLAEFGI